MVGCHLHVLRVAQAAWQQVRHMALLAARASTMLCKAQTGVCCPLCVCSFLNAPARRLLKGGSSKTGCASEQHSRDLSSGPESVPWALKPLAAHTLPSTSCQGPAGMRMGAAGMSKACFGAAASALSSSLLCTRSTSVHISQTHSESEAERPAANRPC